VDRGGWSFVTRVVRSRAAAHGARRWAAALPLFVALTALALTAAGCGGQPGGGNLSPLATPSATPSLSAAAEADLVQAAFTNALPALLDGDLKAWRAALPVGSARGQASPAPGASPEPAASGTSAASPSAGTSSHPGATIGASVTALRRDIDGIFTHLSPLQLRAARALVRAVPGRPHYYSVRFTALIGRAGPPDRILAERILQVEVDRRSVAEVSAAVEPEQGDGAAKPANGGGGILTPAESAGQGAAPATTGGGDSAPAAVRIVAEDTPVEVLRQNVMAFNRPRAIVQPGLVLVYESAWHLRAARLAPLADAARAHVAAVYGVDAGRAAVVFLYASREQALLSLAAGPGQVDTRIKYFSHSSPRVAAEPWSPTDVGVVAPALNGIEAWAPYMLQHEIAHAYTLGWFFDTAHAPEFLEEGLAVAAEESHDWTRLKNALAGGGLDPDLADAIALGNLWSGRKTDDVRVLYSAGGSLMDFILQRWGRSELRRWVRQVSDSDMTREAIAEITDRRFDMTWPAFVADWRAYVEQL
jgi:hypothetical protein